MALSINTNAASLNAQMSLKGSSQALQSNQLRLSTGMRINSAADDAAGLTISDGMSSQIRGMNQAIRNANDGISLAQTAEGGVKEITDMLQRMRELAVQASSDTNKSEDRDAIKEEIDELSAEITRVAEATLFNEKELINGNGEKLEIQVGPGHGDNDQIELNFSGSDAKMTASGLGVSGLTVSSAASGQAAISGIDAAIADADELRSDLGAKINRLESSISNLENASQNLTESRSRIQDADIAKESAEMTQNNVRQQASAAVLAQANQQPQIALQLLG